MDDECAVRCDAVLCVVIFVVSVLLYCWHAYHHTIAPGIRFASMNFFVHSVMYFYYCFMIMGLKWVVQPFAQFITIIQI